MSVERRNTIWALTMVWIGVWLPELAEDGFESMVGSRFRDGVLGMYTRPFTQGSLM